MAVNHVGKGVVWGISTTDIGKNGGTITNGSAIIYASQNVSRAKEMMEHRGNNGEVVGVTMWNDTQQLSIECYPNFGGAGGIATAQTLQNALPVPGDTVTLTDATDSSIGQTWVCESAELRKASDGKSVVSMTLKRWGSMANYNAVT